MLGALKVVGDSNNIDSLLGSEKTVKIMVIPVRSHNEESPPGNIFTMSLKKLPNSAKSFTPLDRNYLTLFFTSQSEDEAEDGKFKSISIRSFVKFSLEMV
ncbi:hypothetical protein K1719_006503 [Acacia pycnantha]|nr:hypothetical protein K1719_006503 [Acacia pycnantha]